ncbi:MAG: tetratricopeptide repeat protein [Sphingobacteriaceae bacterium]|nr:tetratricopeptide repeat protein [Sphingobacteriaceae bacterium]
MCRNLSAFLFTFFLLSGYINWAQEKTEALLLTELKTAKTDSVKADILYELSEICAEKDILKYAEQSLSISEKIKYKKGIANATNNMGFAYVNFGKDLHKALKYYQMSLQANEELNNQLRLGELYSNLGYLLEQLGEYVKALRYYRKSYQIGLQLKDTLLLSVSCGNIGQAWNQVNNEDSTVFYIQKSLYYAKLVNDIHSLSTAYNNLGMQFFKKNNSDSALHYLMLDNTILRQTNDTRGLTFNYVNIGNIYLKNNKADLAYTFAKDAYDLASKLHVSETVKTSSELLSKIYHLKKNHVEAYKFLLIHKNIADSLLNINIRERALESQLKYEFEKQSALAKAEQDKINLQAQEQEKRQKIIIYSVVSGLILVIILVFILYRGYARTQKANKSISKQKLLIEQKQKEILDSIRYAQRIQKSFMAPDKLIEKTLHKLKN